MIDELIAFDKVIASSFFAGKTLDYIFSFIKQYKNKQTRNSIEHQIVAVLDETLEEFCAQINIEFDSDAIISTYLYNVLQLNNIGSRGRLIKILEESTGLVFDDYEYNLWIILFKKNISKPKYSWLFNIIMLSHVERMQIDNYIEIFARVEATHDEMIIEDVRYLDYLQRNSCIINKSFFINEDTICLIVPKESEKILILLTRNFNYNYQNDFKIRLYRMP